MRVLFRTNGKLIGAEFSVVFAVPSPEFGKSELQGIVTGTKKPTVICQCDSYAKAEFYVTEIMENPEYFNLSN